MLQLSLPPEPRSAGKARRFATDALHQWNEEAISDPVALLVSELVTNALLHAGSPVSVTLQHRNGVVRVDVSDESPILPGVRDYDEDATTGRGLELVQVIADHWGIELRQPQGKTVWFELSSAAATAAGPQPAAFPPAPRPPAPPHKGDTVTVRLLGIPVRLFRAVQQHTDALLREYALVGIADREKPEPARLALDLNPLTEQLVTAASEGQATTEVVLEVPTAARSSILSVSDALDAADALAASGQLLQAVALPEIRGCRDWFFDQLLSQLEGGAAQPWVATIGTEGRAPGFDLAVPTVLDALHDAIIVADDRNYVAYANKAVEQVLGWAPEDLAGRRLTTIIPPRLREAHIAGFTHYQVTREPRLIDKPVRVPALRRDGSEVEVELRIHAFRSSGATQMFVGMLRAGSHVDGLAVSHHDPVTLLGALTRVVVAGAPSRSEVLEILAATLQRKVAAWWEPDGAQLSCAATWVAPDSSYEPFVQATRRWRFDSGEGLPGRVWGSRHAEWIPDIVADANFPRLALAVEHRLRTAYALPVITDGELTAVIELFGDAVELPDGVLLEALETAGLLIGSAPLRPG